MGKSKQARNAGLGRSIMRDRFKKGVVADADGWIHTTDMNDGYDWGRLQSVTEQGDLDEFLATAKLAGTEFVAEKLNVTVVSGEHNSAHMSQEKARAVKEAQEANKNMLRVPRRPKWDEDTSADDLQRTERETFLEWRRQLALLQENEHITLSPFERNIEVWRQLWRVIERSHVVVQIVDARNPLLFRSEDLDTYVREVDPTKRTLLLINKADMLSREQRKAWREYLDGAGIPCAFWSASLEKRRQEELEAAAGDEEGDSTDGEDDAAAPGEEVDGNRVTTEEAGAEDSAEGADSHAEETGEETGEEEGADETGEGSDDDAAIADDAAVGMARLRVADVAGRSARTAEEGLATGAVPRGGVEVVADDGNKDDYADVLTREALLSLLRSLCPPLESLGEGRRKTIGLVGYPNVGKSSTINALCQDKKVAVSATPGKTKHFQTILLDEETLLCDCPGLVFPSFASTKAELVVNGMLPIDQMRDYVGPASLVAARIPREVLESTYGIRIVRPGEDEDPNRKPTAHEMLCAYGYARGFMTAHGSPDEPRSARYILKDYCSGRLLYCHAPPNMSDDAFNLTTITWPKALSNAGTDAGHAVDTSRHDLVGPKHAQRYDNRVDRDFFRQSNVGVVVRGVQHGGKGDHVRVVHPHNRARGVDGAESKGKRHNNRNKREKVRRVMNEA